MNKNELFFIIRVFNEAKIVGTVIKELHSMGYKNLIVVDDGSSDNSLEILSKTNGIYLLHHVINRGAGAALKTGIDYALTFKECKYIATIDADGQHRLSDLNKFIKVLDEDSADFVIGSRFLNKESSKLVPFKKKLLLKAAIVVTIFLSSIRLTDSHNGYRVMNRKAAEQISLTFDGFEYASELIDEIEANKLRIKEVPVNIDYTEYSMQKGQKMTNSIRIFFKMIFKK